MIAAWVAAAVVVVVGGVILLRVGDGRSARDSVRGVELPTKAKKKRAHKKRRR